MIQAAAASASLDAHTKQTRRCQAGAAARRTLARLWCVAWGCRSGRPARRRKGSVAALRVAQEESFRAFTLRPENRAIVEAAQREEALQSVEAAEREATRELLAQVEAAGPEVAAALSPFLSTPVLRRIILSFANDAEHGLRFWALNQQAQVRAPGVA